MNLQSEKKILINWISDLKDESTIRELLELKDSFDNINGQCLNEPAPDQKETFETRIKNSNEDHFNPYKHLKVNVTNWLLKLIL